MILLYHKIYPEVKTEWWVTPNSFYLQMHDLQTKKVVYLDDYDASNPDLCVITFDGVYDNLWKYAVPILRHFGYPFELFIVGSTIGQGNEFDTVEPHAPFADKDTLAKMVAVGGRLQWHTWSHPVLVGNYSEEIYRRELAVPDDLRNLDPQGFKWFAFPHGQRDEALKAQSRKYFQGALACDDGDMLDPYDLQRTTVFEKSRFSTSTVSMVIPCYNYGHFAAEAIESALYQIYPPDEILFIDDHSSDNSVEIAKRYEPHIRVEANSQNLGIIKNFSKAVELTKGDYICFLGADNRFRSDYLEKSRMILNTNPDVGVVYTHFALFGDRAHTEAIRMNAHPHSKIQGVYLKEFPENPERDIQQENYIHGSSMYRRMAYTQAGGYSQDYLPEDQSLFARILLNKWKAKLLDDYVLEYRQHSKDQINQLKGLEMENVHLRNQQKAFLNQLKIKDQMLQEHWEKEQALTRLGEEKEQKIQEYTAWIVHLDENIQSLKTELQKIKTGVIWKIYQLLVRLRLALIPSGSNRENMAHMLLRGIRTVRIEETSTLFARGMQKIKRILARRKKVAVSPLISDKTSNSNIEVYVPLNQENVVIENILAKVIAFYLPQFHPIPENDKWWGKGFTEWSNVSKATPNFAGHYQPHQPGELGFYDLRLPEVQQQQVELAKKYGIFGFCFYYYWFAGKRLLERPLDQYLANPHLDLPFCLCWANENWTRRWDGAEHEILIAQEYTEDQYLHFIKDISPNFGDPRYIRVDGKPILLVYRINLLPDPQKAADVWRAECRRLGIGEIYLVAVQSFGIKDPRPYGFDAAVEFPPSHLSEAEVNRNTVEITNLEFSGRIFDYKLAARAMLEKKHGDYTVFKTVMPSWDNTARKQNDAHIFINSSPSAYKEWLEKAVKQTQRSLPENKRFVFVNAWNEWAEGTHLEPDRKYGYAYLQATADAITKSPSGSGWTILFVSHDAHRGGAQAVLINTIAWFKQHTNINVKILCLQGGDWLSRFEELADTIVLNELGSTNDENKLIENLLKFCGQAPDLIYGNTVVAGSAYVWLDRLNVPILTHFHELETSIQKYGSGWIQDAIKYSSHFVACSKAVQENLVQNHDVPLEKISLIYSSIVSKRSSILDNKAKKDVRKKLKLNQDQVLIFGCGIGMPFRKGADLFIQLGEILLQRGYRNFHLYWIGEFEHSYQDGKYGIWADHSIKLKHKELKKHITFLGMQDDPSEYLSCGDIFVLPSREDPFPLVALEAADCGLPIICFDKAGGISDFVGEDAGYVIPLEDLEGMANKAAALMDDKESRHKLGMRAREKVLAEFMVDHTTPYILSTSRQVAKKKPAASVIVPNYNHAPYLDQRLKSIFGQTFRDFEVILLDDASTDGSMDILKKYIGYPDVQIVCNEKNSGSPFKQWLKGLDLATSDILWIAESDDVCASEFLETLLPAFDDPKVKLAYSNSHIINEKDEITGDYLGTEYLSSLSKEKWRRNYKAIAEQEINDGLGVKNTILNISAVLLKRFKVEKEFSDALKTMRIAGDWFFIVNAIKNGSVYYNARKLNSHRRHSNSVIAQAVTKKKIQEFFEEFFVVQNYIINTYPLHYGFLNKWESYLRKQWSDFTNHQNFDEISAYYSFNQLKQAILDNIGETNVN